MAADGEGEAFSWPLAGLGGAWHPMCVHSLSCPPHPEGSGLAVNTPLVRCTHPRGLGLGESCCGSKGERQRGWEPKYHGEDLLRGGGGSGFLASKN